MFSRRQVLAASAALPAIVATLAATGCEPVDAALGKKPSPPRDVETLQAAIAAEQNLIDLYNRTISSYPALSAGLTPLLDDHRAHLARLRSHISYPRGYVARPTASPSSGTSRAAGGASSPGAGGAASPAGAAGGRGAAVASVRDAESAAAAAQLGRLATASPSIAQLLASISASENTHAAVLGSLS